ncbi:sterile alpha motif domain-containing protein 3 isoform X2 [Lepidochelys kempii]|uniref:sterile alpha motif domain-containing protein 3 isoform X2 n=1 Tax=Lepidochelys kempii TaxID=8472 RepID=UPI003C6F3AFB
MESWSVDEVCNWLVQRNLGDLVPKFREEEVSGAALLALNDRMVQQLVKKIGHQAVLMDLINKYQQQNNGLESFTYSCEITPPKSPEANSGTMGIQVFSPFSPTEQTGYISPTEKYDGGLIDRRVLKQKKNMKHVFARCETVQWTNSYVLPEFPYDVQCILEERKCPDHSMRIRIIEFLQADMTKYLEGSLYPNSQQYNVVVNALLQAYPFLDEDGNGFEEIVYLEGHDAEMDEHIVWFKQEYMKTERNWEEVDKRMNKTLEMRRKMISNKAPLKEILRLFPFLRCPYELFREFQLLTHMDIYKKTVEILEIYSGNILTLYSVRNNPINVLLRENLKQHTEEDILKYMKMTATCLLLPDVFGDDSSLFTAVNEEVKVLTPVLEVKNPFSVNTCEFALYIEKEKLAQLDDCTMALAALLAAFHVFGIQYPKRIHNTFHFLESLILEMKSPQSLPKKVKRKLEELECLNI